MDHVSKDETRYVTSVAMILCIYMCTSSPLTLFFGPEKNELKENRETVESPLFEQFHINVKCKEAIYDSWHTF